MKDTTAPPAEVAGIPTERLAPMHDGSVREYDRPYFAEAEGVGRYQDREAVRVRTHPPGSEVAAVFRPIMEERNKPQPVTRMGIAHMEQARDLYAVQGKNDEAASCERMVHRMRAGFAILARRRATPALAITRVQGVARPRERSYRRSSSPSRAGPSDDEGPSDEPPPAGRLCSCGCELALVGLRSHARFLNDAHRKRYQRQLDRLQPERMVERSADRAPRAKHCRCNGGHLEFEPGHCFNCGHDLAGGWRGLDDKLSARTFVTTRGVPKPNFSRYGDRKRKPVREIVDESIIRKAAA